MKFLSVIFCYNRFNHMKSMVDSWFEFFGEGDLLIVDDNSTDTDLVAYLESLRKNGVDVQVMDAQNQYGHVHGGLYENMDFAVEYARTRGYEYIYFLQDDLQFLWKNPDFLDTIEDLFARFPDTSMIQNSFVQKIWVDRGIVDRKVISIEDGPCYTFGNGMLAVGITRTDLLVDNNFRFAIGNESSASRWWLYQGCRALALRNPNLCFVPEPSVAREREITRGTHVPPRKYFVKPLDDEQISKLNSADLCEYPFWEDYCEAWGWTARKPYWKRADDTYYRQYYRRKNIARFQKLKSAAQRVVPGSIRSRLVQILVD